MIDNCLCVTAIGLGITGVGLLSTIVAAPVVIGIETVSIVMGLLRVVRNQAIKKVSVVSFQKHYQMTSFQIKNIH